MGRIDDLFVTAGRLFPERYPPATYPNLDFHASRWDFANSVGRSQMTIHFALWAGKRRFPDRFEKAVKACLVLEEAGLSGMNHRVRGVAYLLMEMERQHAKYGELSTTDILESDIEGVPGRLRALQRASRTISSYTYALAQFVNWGKRNGIVSPAIRAAGIGLSQLLEEEAVDPTRIPPTAIVRVLGKLYREVEEPRDRLRLCAGALLLIGGFRVGEVVVLQTDCLKYEEDAEGIRRWYIEYRNGKARRGDRREIRRRWLSPLAAELAGNVIAEILGITAPWRAQAGRMDAYDDRVPLPSELQSIEYLHRSEFGHFLGWDSGRDGRALVARHLGHLTKYRNTERRYRDNLHANCILYHVRDIERYLATLRDTQYTFEMHDGSRIRIIDTLLIQPDNYYHPHQCSRLGIMKPMSTSVMQRFLSDEESGIFARYGFFDLDGRPLKVNTHGFRHWLNTVANKSGMTFLQITIWMGRTEEIHTLRYIGDPIEIAEIVREESLEGRLRGARLDKARRLSAEARRQEADSSIETVHCVDGLYCTLDFHLGRCPQGKHCLDDCDYAAFDPGNPVQVEQLREKRDMLAVALPVLKSRPGPVATVQAKRLERELATADDWLSDVREGGGHG